MSSTPSSNNSPSEPAACTPAPELDNSPIGIPDREFVQTHGANVQVLATRIKNSAGFKLQFSLPAERVCYVETQLHPNRPVIISVYARTEEDAFRKAAYFLKTPRRLTREKYRL